MAQSKIQLRKIRDFGDNISDTFQFIRQEGKSLVLSFLVVGGIFMFINAIVSGIYQKQTFGFMDSLSERAADYNLLTDGPDVQGMYSVYQEGIYLDYRYYETRYEDAVMGTGNAGDTTD